ncbi:hypothetical protein BJ322DRAFT_783082 [Thelephora terrestris]|uniref:F-box domain-containing protein n=1 Tax=Thelephora terrestris TaxID=56493 RepID=A0A9P6HFZ8_9AGAM|nr:hypothetical protein BJ322DRAFT_783082 [Thelephora terrestris]
MHHCLNVDEIVRLIAGELVSATERTTTVALACCNKTLKDPVLDVLWETQCQLLPLLKTLPEDIWNPGGYESFQRLPTTQEWSRLREYARRMRNLQENAIGGFLSHQVLSVLQSHASSEPLLPNLKTFTLRGTRGDSIPFIPLFLSPRTTAFNIVSFGGGNLRGTVTASMITNLSTLCPNLEQIGLYCLPKDPIIASAVSGLLLTTNRSTLRDFSANLLLTEEACKVIFKLPGLRKLQAHISGPTALPTMMLPNLTELEIGHDGGHDWLQGFRGASLGKLVVVSIHSESDSIDDFLGAFASVALTTSLSATLLTFMFRSKCAWRPSYRSLLPFTQLRKLDIEFSCKFGCSSTIDDDTITDLARAMPKLEALRFGDRPCETPAGVTIKGLSALAHHCPHLRSLSIHFQVASLDVSEMHESTSSDDCAIPREDCALLDLDVGATYMPEESALMVALTLLRIFPRLKWIEHNCEGWEKVAAAIELSSELADHSNKKPMFA